MRNVECHAHLFMDGIDYRKAVAAHKSSPNEKLIREHLQAYRDAGIAFVREGGDKYGVSELGKKLAPMYGIDYRSPVYALHREGHYGGIVGYPVSSLKEFARRVRDVKIRGADFVKIMVSGIMEYSEFGRLSENALEEDWIREMIHIAHEEGFAVMVHANGREAVLPAVRAGADSIEHGNYIDKDCICAMAESGCVWVPTIVTTKNLIGCGRYNDETLQYIYEMECENVRQAIKHGVLLAAGSDAGAYKVPHGQGALQEAELLEALGADLAGEEVIRKKFALDVP